MRTINAARVVVVALVEGVAGKEQVVAQRIEEAEAQTALHSQVAHRHMEQEEAVHKAEAAAHTEEEARTLLAEVHKPKEVGADTLTQRVEVQLR